jgi:Copper type II ascorbate-dependent monooxygenase, C-terminal domain
MCNRLKIGFAFCSGLLMVMNCGLQKNAQPTFSKDIAPIIYKHCTPCHRPNQIGHFSLMTYADVQSQATTILYTITNRLMPPWPADVHYSRFANEMVMTDAEIELMSNWINNKCPIGDSNQVPKVPSYQSLSFLGTPDLSIPIKPNLIKGNFTDQFLLIKVPFTLPQNAYAHTIEFVPGNTKVVHHVNADLVRYDDAKKANVFDGNWVHDGVNDSTVRNAYKQMGMLHDDGSYPVLHRNAMNYLPGVIAQRYPDGIGDIALGKKNAFLLSDMHYGPYWENTWDSSSINIYFSKTPPSRTVEEFQLGTLGVSPVVPNLQLQPNKITTVHSQYSLPKAISIITLNPHMHLLGQSFWAFAVAASGDTIPLIKIPRWDFNWQNYYKPHKPIVLQQGTTIYAVGVYDNTEANPFNPNKPPKLVTDKDGSMRTTDEMFQFIVSYMEYMKGDEELELGEGK